MKKLLIAFYILGSVSANAAEDCSVNLQLDVESPRVENRIKRIIQNKGYVITDNEAAFKLRVWIGDVDGGYQLGITLPYYYAYGDVVFSQNGEIKVDSKRGQGTLFVSAKTIFKATALSDIRSIPDCMNFKPFSLNTVQ